MTKIATKKPEVQCRPVYLSQDVYEVWYAQPKSLGKITMRGGYWYTATGERFVSSRDAMGYMLRIAQLPIPANLQTKALSKPIPAPKPPEVKPVPPRVFPGVNSRKLPRGNSISGPRPTGTLDTAINQPGGIEYNQNHPMFQEFLEFQEYVAKKRAGLLGEKTSLDNASN